MYILVNFCFLTIVNTTAMDVGPVRSLKYDMQTLDICLGSGKTGSYSISISNVKNFMLISIVSAPGVTLTNS